MKVKPMLTLASACFVWLPVVVMAQQETQNGKKTETDKLIVITATDVTVAYEVFSMDAAKAIAIRREHPTDAALYAALIAAEEKGDAVQEALAAVRGRSGGKHSTRSANELMYPVEWERVAFPKQPQQGQPANVFAVPGNFQTRNVGLSFEMMTEVEKGSPFILLKADPDFVTYTGNSVWGQGNAAVETPEFIHLWGRTMEVRAKDGEPFFLGTLSPQKTKERSPQRIWLAFATSVVTNLETKQQPLQGDPFDAAPAENDAPPAPSYSLAYEAFSLPLKDAAALRRKPSRDPDLHKELVARVAKGEAIQEAFTVIRGNSGRQLNSDNITEHISPTQYNAPDFTDGTLSEQHIANLELPFISTAFETRNCGTTIGIEPSASADSKWVDLQADISHVTLGKAVRWGKDAAQTERPLYESQVISTHATALLGVPCFLGTINPPDKLQGDAKPDRRVWFAFVTPDLAK